MDNILICSSCGARMRIRPATLKVVKEVKCVKCRGSVPVPDEMRKAAQDGTLVVPPETIKHKNTAHERKGGVSRHHSVKIKSKLANRSNHHGSEKKHQAEKKQKAPERPVIDIKPIGGGDAVPSKSVRKPVVVTKRRSGFKPVSLDAPVNDGKPMRPKTIIAPPPASAPVTVAPAAGGLEVSSATVKLVPSGANVSKIKPATPMNGVKKPVRLGAAGAQSPTAGISPQMIPVINKAVADIEALETRLAKLEVASLEDRVASLEKMSVSMTAREQHSMDELKSLSERIATLRKTVSGIDNRVACMLKATLEHAIGLTSSLDDI